MNFDLTSEQLMVTKAAKRFAEEVCAPIAEEIDREHRFPRETFDLLTKYGFVGTGFPREYGGTGNDKIAQLIVVEELAKVCMATSSIFSIHQGMANCLLKFGNKEQKDKYLRSLLCEGTIGAFALTEDNAGSDASNIQTTAVLDGEEYIINGTKRFITGAGQAGLYIVLAYTEPELKTRGITAFIVEPETPGFSVGKIENKMGICASHTGELVFENVRVPKENILGKYNQGFKVALTSIDDARVLTVGAQCLGVAESALNLAVEYAKSRIQFGKPVILQQGLQWYVAEMATKIEATKWMTYHAAQQIQDGKTVTKNCAMVKFYASEMARGVVERALQIHGGYGYMKDYAIERMYRDIKITELYEGTNEIQKLVIAREVIGKV
jgi:alkylation response protein AidB-like acyl-CoA dehydrogenase